MEKQRLQGGIIDRSVDPHLVDWNWVSLVYLPVSMVTVTIRHQHLFNNLLLWIQMILLCLHLLQPQVVWYQW